VELSSI